MVAPSPSSQGATVTQSQYPDPEAEVRDCVHWVVTGLLVVAVCILAGIIGSTIMEALP